jgi:hypothetical protein
VIRRSLPGLLLLALGACSAYQIPIVGQFMPSPADDMMRNAQANQQNAMINYSFRPGWKNLIDGHKYKAALDYIQAHKSEIGEANEKTYTEDTNRECKSYVTTQLSRLRRSIQEAKSQKDVAAMKSDEFESAFSVPPPDELIYTTPAYDWARTYAVAFEDFRSRKPSGEGLLKATAESAKIPADDDGEYRWFDAMEALAYAALSDAVRADVEKSQDAAKSVREEARARTERLHRQWTLMYEALDSGFKPRARVGEHDVQLGRLREGFPKDLTEDLDRIDIGACLAAGSPESELQKVERSLKALDARSGVARESRQRLYTMIVTVVSLRGFLQGKEEADVVAELKGYADKLAKVGGPGDTRAYGARVQSVFDALLR